MVHYYLMPYVTYDMSYNIKFENFHLHKYMQILLKRAVG